jgi:hypothetical protein
MKPENLEDYLVSLYTGQWFGWSDSKNKVYANLIIHDSSKTKPTEQECIDGLAQLQAQEEQDKIDKEARIASAKAKLEALGLTTEEIKDTFGL